MSQNSVSFQKYPPLKSCSWFFWTCSYETKLCLFVIVNLRVKFLEFGFLAKLCFCFLQFRPEFAESQPGGWWLASDYFSPLFGWIQAPYLPSPEPIISLSSYENFSSFDKCIGLIHLPACSDFASKCHLFSFCDKIHELKSCIEFRYSRRISQRWCKADRKPRRHAQKFTLFALLKCEFRYFFAFFSDKFFHQSSLTSGLRLDFSGLRLRFCGDFLWFW